MLQDGSSRRLRVRLLPLSLGVECEPTSDLVLGIRVLSVWVTTEEGIEPDP